jgi:hypothetical protein
MEERDFFVGNARYVGFVAVPAVWLLARHADAARPAVRVMLVVSFAILVAGGLFFAKPQVSSYQQVATDLDGLMGDGDTVGFVDVNNHLAYKFYFQLTHDGTRDLRVQLTCILDPTCPPEAKRPDALNATWVVLHGSDPSLLPPGYVTVPGTHAGGDPGHPEYLTLWHRGPLLPRDRAVPA